MIQLENTFMQVSIDELNNANIVSLVTKDGVDSLDKKGLCTWLKSGHRLDPSTNVLGNPYKKLLVEPINLVNQSESKAIFSRTVDGLTITKRITIDNNSLKVDLLIENNSSEDTPQLQVEYFNMFAGGQLEQRPGMFTSIIDCSEIKDFIEGSSFGERYVKAFDYNKTSIIVGDKNRGYWLKLSSDYDCETVTVMTQGNTLTRGFNSLKFELKPGETFVHGMNFDIHTGEIPGEYIKIRKGKPKIAKNQAIDNVAALFKGEAVFKERWSHLCIQYDRTEPDAVKKIISEMLTPLRYNGVIFEFDRGLQTTSHPELAESWSWSVKTAKDVIAFARRNGLKVGVEFNVPGHQNETGIEKVYPELLECSKLTGRASTLCVSNVKAHKIVKDIYDEYQEAFQPDLILLGSDEVQFEGHSSTLGICPLCKGKEPASLFRNYLGWLLELIRQPDTAVVIYGDMFLQSEQFGSAVSGNGSAGNAWKSLDGLSKRYTIADWHYYPSAQYKSLDFFLEKGYNVTPVTAFNFEGIRLFLRDAEKHNIPMAIHTTWAVPNQEKLPIESMVWAAVYHWLGMKADELPVKKLANDFCYNFW